MGALECFYLSLQCVPTMEGAHYQNDYAIIKDYAQERELDALELLNIFGRIREEIYTKK